MHRQAPVSQQTRTQNHLAVRQQCSHCITVLHQIAILFVNYFSVFSSVFFFSQGHAVNLQKKGGGGTSHIVVDYACFGSKSEHEYRYEPYVAALLNCMKSIWSQS